MPGKLPSEEELEAEFDKARRESPKYRLRASGNLIIDAKVESAQSTNWAATLVVSLSLALLFGCAATDSEEGQDYAYLILRSTEVDQTMDQPEQIGLCKNRTVDEKKCVFYDTQGPILRLDSGWYSVEYVKFDGTELGINHRLDFRGFKVEPGNIYYFGHIQFDHARSRFEKQRFYELVADPDLLREACETYPALFEELPVINIQKGDKARFSCTVADN